MIEYYKNYILCAELETFYCLVCKERLDKDILDLHISVEVHKQNANRQICLAKYSNDSIYQIGDIYYCQICNYIITKFDKIEIHINTVSHNENKNNPEKVGRSLIPKRMKASIDIGNNINVSLREWHGISKYNCLICNPGVSVDIIEHINIESHVLNMMNTVTKYDNNGCYRQFNDETLYCFECKTIFPSTLLPEHWHYKKHKIGKEGEQKRNEIKLEETEVEQENIKEKGKNIDRGNKIEKYEQIEDNKKVTKIIKRRKKIMWIQWFDWEENLENGQEKPKKGKEEKEDMNVEKKIDQEIKETKEQIKQEADKLNKKLTEKKQETKKEMGEKLGEKKEEEEAVEKIEGEIKQIKEERQRKEEKETNVEQKLEFNHLKEEMNIQKQENVAERSEKGKVEIIQEESQRLKEIINGLARKEVEDREENQNKNSEIVQNKIHEANENIQQNKQTESDEAVKDLRMKLFHCLKRNFDINFDKFESKCKLCQQYVNMHFQDMVDHYKKHMKEVKNYYVTKPKLAYFESIYDHGKARSELATFGRKHFMKLTQGGVKGYCSLCNIYVAPHIKNFEIHVNGDRHRAHLAIKGLLQSSMTNEKPNYNAISFLSYIQDISFPVTMQLAWVNKEFCITIYSFYLVAPFGPTKKILKCFACDLEFDANMLMPHVFCQMHQDKWYNTQVIVDLEKDFFTREIRPGLYHCGCCNVAIPYWQSLQRHFSSVAHKGMRNEFQYVSKCTNEWYSEMIQRGDNNLTSLLTLLDNQTSKQTACS